MQIHAVAHAHRLGGDEIAAGDADVGAGHGRIGQAHGEQRFDFHPHRAGGFLDAFQGVIVGDAQAVDVADRGAAFGQLFLDLRPRTMHQHQAHAQAVEQVEVVRQRDELAFAHHFAAEGDDESLAAKLVDIRRGGAEPLHEHIDENFGFDEIRFELAGHGRV